MMMTPRASGINQRSDHRRHGLADSEQQVARRPIRTEPESTPQGAVSAVEGVVPGQLSAMAAGIVQNEISESNYTM